MSKEYLKYIPKFLPDNKANAILLTAVPAILYCLAAFASLYLKGYSLVMLIIISVFFATLEYICRVPINLYSANEAKMTNTEIQGVWIVLTLLFSKLSDIFFPRF